MTVADFFRLVIKLFALYCLITTVFTIIPGAIGLIQYNDVPGEWYNLLWIALVTVLMSILFITLAYHADRVVEKLNLARGFDNTHIPFEKMDAYTIIHVACIIVGGLIFLRSLPSLLTHLYIALRMKASESLVDMVMGYTYEKNAFELAVDVLNLAISYLLLTNYARISKWLVTRQGVNE